MVVLSLFDLSCEMVKPWAEAGFICMCVDIQHAEGMARDGNIIRIGADVRTWLPPRRADFAVVFAFPPCTHLAVSGARWFRGKGLGKLAESIELFSRAAEICEWSEAPYFIENPVSTIATYWRKPDVMFDPCDYGDPYTKKTCLWTGNGFVLPPKTPVLPLEGSRMHLMPPSADRAEKRSKTPPGFARAVFSAMQAERIAA